MTKYNIVQIGDRYAIRKTTFGITKYKDLNSQGFWWSKDNEYFSHCLGDLERVQKYYDVYINKDIIIK